MLQAGKTTALYCRLSQEDMQAGESESIQNQENIYQGGKTPSVSATHAHARIGKKPDRQDIVCRCQSCYAGITFRFKLA